MSMGEKAMGYGRPVSVAWCVLIMAWAVPATGAEQTFVLRYDPVTSGMTATLDVQVASDGSLIGDFDLEDNPEGTRTKPGLFGSFEETENEAVPASVAPGLSGDWTSATDGYFLLTVDVDTGIATVTSLTASLLSSGPVVLSGTLEVGFDTFRTRAPESLYIGATLPIPLGDAVLRDLEATQLPTPAVGTVEAIAGDDYAINVTVPVVMSGVVSLLATEFELPSLPMAIVLQGELTLTDDSASLSSVQDFLTETAEEPDLPLPAIPFDLPTILPPGETAHVLLDLMLTQIGLTLEGDLVTHAAGVPLGTGDCDGDDLVTLTDLQTLNACLTGPAGTFDPVCACVDTDGDGDVDLLDVAAYQRAFE